MPKILLFRWELRGNPQRIAREYEQRIFDFLNGEVYYPDDVDVFDVLGRQDLKSHRALGPCCQSQIGFIRPLLEWIDDCWPQTDEDRRELREKLTNSLCDEVKYCRKEARARSRAN